MPGWAPRLSPILHAVLLFFCVAVSNPAEAQDTTTLPQGQVGKPYAISIGIDTENGKGQFTWKLAHSDLPPGLQVSAAGKIEGTPTDTKSDSYVFELSVSDSSQPPQSAMLRFSIVILSAPLRIRAVNVAATQLKLLGVSAVDATSGASTSASATGAAPDPVTAATPATGPPAEPKPATVQPASNARAAQGNSGGQGAGGAGTANQSQDPDPAKGNPPDQKACWKSKEDVGYCGGPLLRTIVGFEQAGVSSAQSKQNFFFDLLYDRPLGLRLDPDLGAPLRGWGNLRISSVPQQINTSVAQFAAGFAQQVGNLQVNQVAQSFEFLGGIEYRLFPGPPKKNKRNESRRNDIGYAIPPPSDRDIREVASLNLILGGGVITPLTPQDSVQEFDVPANQPTFFTQYPQAVGKQFVAFTLPDRNRFFRQAYGGLRLMSHPLGDSARVRFPETLDITYGFNESITGGRIRGGVLRLEGFVPIPYASVSWIYFFGTGMFKPGGRAVITSPFLLQTAPAGTLPSDPNAVVIITPQANRDYYRIGMGIDFIDLVKNWGKKPPTAAATAASDTEKKPNQ